jgi:hypothetical protein
MTVPRYRLDDLVRERSVAVVGFVEHFADVAFGLAPVTREQARALLGALRAWPLLTGARGRAQRTSMPSPTRWSSCRTWRWPARLSSTTST